MERKKAKYRELIKQLGNNFEQVKFMNLSTDFLGIFAHECSTFLDMLENVDLDKNHQIFCVRKMMTTVIIEVFIIFSVAEIRNGKIQNC